MLGSGSMWFGSKDALSFDFARACMCGDERGFKRCVNAGEARHDAKDYEVTAMKEKQSYIAVQISTKTSSDPRSHVYHFSLHSPSQSQSSLNHIPSFSPCPASASPSKFATSAVSSTSSALGTLGADQSST